MTRLAERFKLALHRETREASRYALEIAKNGPKVKESRNEAKPTVDVNKDLRPDLSGQALKLPRFDLDQNGFPIIHSDLG
jgi:uncharacterized protein (TIGR03435 family)